MAELSAVARALLETIAGPESAGDYNVIYGGQQFSGYGDHPRINVPIESGPNKGLTSSAAGKYQFIKGTWDDIAQRHNLSDFSPQNQDLGAWYLAQEEYARDYPGRNLEKDLLAGDLSRVAPSLRNQWTSMPGGIEQGITGNAFTQAYNSALAGIDQAVPRNKPNLGNMAMAFGQTALNNLSLGQKLSLLGQKNNLQAAGNAMGVVGALPGMLGQRAGAAGNWLANNIPGGQQVQNAAQGLFNRLAGAPRPPQQTMPQPQQAGFMLARNLMNPQSAGALSSGNAGYSLGGTVLPTVATNGMARNTYGDTGGSISSMGGSGPYWDPELGRMVVPGKQ